VANAATLFALAAGVAHRQDWHKKGLHNRRSALMGLFPIGRDTMITGLLRAALALWLLVALPAAAWAAPTVSPSARVQSRVIVRAAPSTDAERIGTLEPGQLLEVLGSQPYWYQVRLPDGRTGYVSRAWTVVTETAADGQYRMHVIDVGTGLAVFVEGPDFTLLYDAGSNDDTRRGSANRVLAYLRHVRPNLQTIDHVILSHPHRDHVELLPDIFDAYQIRHVWDSGRNNPICGYRAFLDRVTREAGVTYHNALPGVGAHVVTFAAKRCYGQNLPATTVTISRGAPLAEGTAFELGAGSRLSFLTADGSDHPSANENSVVARLDLGSRRVLFMGDAEAGGRQNPSNTPSSESIEGHLLACCSAELRADILVVGHHGSMTSSREAFLDRVGANQFAVSAGPTRYGSVTLPDQVVIAALEARGTVWRTDLNDPACRLNAAKIGPDNDRRPGGCDNVRFDIDANGEIRAAHYRVAD